MATLRSWKRLIEKAADPVELRTRARAIDFSLTDLDSLCTVVAARRRARNRAATHESERSRAEACARSPTERAMERLESGRRLEDAVSETMALRRIARHDETGLEKTWEATPARVAIARRVLRFRPDLMRDWIVDPAKSGTVVLAALAGLAHRDWPRAEQAIDAIEESDAGMRALLRARLAMQQERLDDAGRELEDAQRWSRHFSCRRTEAAALAESARLALRKREPREATQFADRALRLRRACGDYWGEGDAQALLAEVAAGRGDLPAAKKSCEAVAAIRQAIGDRRGLGLNLVNLANLTSQMGEPSRAIYEEAIVALRAVGAKRALAGAKTNLAVLLRQTGSTRRAEELLNEVLEEHRAIGGRAGEAITLENLAILAFRSGRIGAAREGHRDALRIFREIGDMRHVALVEENMATIEAETGNPRGALELLESARRVHEEGGDQRMEAHARGNLAILWTRIGFPTRAIEHYEAAIEAFASVGDKRLEGRHVAQLALLYAEAGAPERAERVLRRALKLHRRVRDRRYEGETLTHLGALAIRAGRWKKAKAAVAEGLAIHRAESHGGFEGKARALLGEIALAEGETEEAEACFRKALALHAEHRALGEEARTRARLAAVAMRRGELTRVREMARHALRILDRIHEPARRHELLHLVALSLAREGIDSRAAFTEAIEALEEWVRRVPPEQMRLEILEDSFRLFSDALTNLPSDESAPRAGFELCERSRARVFVDGMAGSTPTLHQDPRVREAESELRAAQGALRREQEAAHPREAILTHLRRRIAGIRARHEQALQDLALRRPHAAAEEGLAPLMPAESIQRILCGDGETALLEYYVTDEQTLLLILLRDTLQLERIPIGHRDLSKRIGAALQPIDQTSRSANPLHLWRLKTQPLRELAGLLIGPALPALGSVRRLLIVPAPVLQPLPFEMLVLRMPGERGWKPPPDADRYSAPEYLVERFEVAYGASANALALSCPRSAPPNRDTKVVAFGDPEALPPLPATGLELEAIAAHYPRAHLLRGSEAGIARYRELAPRADLLHLGCHGVIDLDRPAYSGLLLAGKEGEDALLQSYEIAEILLPRAPTVVLSGCRVAGGKLSRVEGYLGLCRAFSLAGAGIVLGSIWPVEEEAGAALCRAFYAALRHSHGDALAAISAAKRSMLRRESRDRPLARSHPYFWAGFRAHGAAPAPSGGQIAEHRT